MKKRLMRGHIDVQKILNGYLLKYTLKFKGENDEGNEWEEVKEFTDNLEQTLVAIENIYNKYESTNY